jgi:hypothetical protein
MKKGRQVAHMQRGQSKQQQLRQRRGLLVFSKLPSRPSAGRRSGCFHSSLACKPRSLIQVSLGWFDYSNNVRKDNLTPADSPVSDRRRLTALLSPFYTLNLKVISKKYFFAELGPSSFSGHPKGRRESTQQVKIF